MTEEVVSKYERHPSYGMLSVTRCQMDQVLFDEPDTQHTFYELVVRPAKLEHTKFHDWVGEAERIPLLAIKLSAKQLADLIGSQRASCTISVNNGEKVEAPPQRDLLAQISAEVYECFRAPAEEDSLIANQIAEAIKNKQCTMGTLNKLGKAIAAWQRHRQDIPHYMSRAYTVLNRMNLLISATQNKSDEPIPPVAEGSDSENA